MKPVIGVSVRVYLPSGSPVIVMSFVPSVVHVIVFSLIVTFSALTVAGISVFDVRVNAAPAILFPRTSYLANVIGTVC